VKKFNRKAIFGVWLIGGFIGMMVSAMLMLPGGAWLILTVSATAAAMYLESQVEYAVFFDMSSGKTSVFRSASMEEVERVESDIVQGMEEGRFPDYLQGE
jgi:hypothetical protein